MKDMFIQLEKSFGLQFLDNCALVFTHWENNEKTREEREEKKRTRTKI